MKGKGLSDVIRSNVIELYSSDYETESKFLYVSEKHSHLKVLTNVYSCYERLVHIITQAKEILSLFFSV